MAAAASGKPEKIAKCSCTPPPSGVELDHRKTRQAKRAANEGRTIPAVVRGAMRAAQHLSRSAARDLWKLVRSCKSSRASEGVRLIKRQAVGEVDGTRKGTRGDESQVRPGGSTPREVAGRPQGRGRVRNQGKLLGGGSGLTPRRASVSGCPADRVKRRVDPEEAGNVPNDQRNAPPIRGPVRMYNRAGSIGRAAGVAG